MEAVRTSRRSKRLVPLKPVTIAIEEGTRRIYGVAKNISEGGLCIVTNEELKPESTFHLKLSFPHHDVLEARGRTVWNDVESDSGPQTAKGCLSSNILNGLEFSGLSPDVSQKLRDILCANGFCAEA